MKQKKIVKFGDSLTDYFPMDKLNDIDAEIINSGQAGDTIAEMGARVQYDVIAHKPDIVLMQGGANDFLLSLYPGYDIVAKRLVNLALRIRKELPQVRLIVESMYPAYTKRIGLMPSWADGKSNEEIQRINGEIQRLCDENKIEYIDVFCHLIGADGQLPREYTIDGIHLQDNAYEVVRKCICKML